MDKFQYSPYNGSKRWMLSHLEPLFRAWSGKGRFIDPFCGGGSPSWLMRKCRPQAHQILSDVDPFLLACYQVQSLGLEPKIPEDFTDLKDWYLLGDRDLPGLSTEDKALRFMITCLTAWGHRLKPKPHGTLSFTVNPEWVTSEYLKPRLTSLLATRWLQTTDTVLNQDWKETIRLAKSGDFVFLDPPYTETLGYSKRWTVADQVDVWECVDKLVVQGVSVVVTNSSEMTRLYARTALSSVELARPGTGNTAKARTEMLAWSPDLRSIFDV